MGLIGSRIDDVSGIANRDHSSWWDPTQKAFNGLTEVHQVLLRLK